MGLSGCCCGWAQRAGLVRARRGPLEPRLFSLGFWLKDLAAARPGPDWRPEACGALSQASGRRGKAPPVRKTPWSDSSTLPPPLAGPSDPRSADTKMTAASGGVRKGGQPWPFLWLGSPAPLPGPQCTTWEKTLALIVAALGGHARPKATTRFLAPPHTHTSPAPRRQGSSRARPSPAWCLTKALCPSEPWNSGS